MNETTFIGKERIIPCSNTRGIWLKQVVVADQHSKDENNKGGDASCGYHCVKNFAFLAKSLNDADYARVARNLILSFDIVNDLFGKYKDNKNAGLHRKQVLQSDKQHVDGGDWITDNDIKDLIKKESQPLGILDKIPFGLSVIENISQEKIPAEGEVALDVQQARESAIKKEIDAARSSLGQEMDCAHGFILNHFEQGLNKGHWFVVVIKKYIQQNKIDVIIADSKNIVRFNNASVRALLQKLFSFDLQPDLNEIGRLKQELCDYMQNLGMEDLRKRAEKLNSVYCALGGEDVFTQKIMNAVADAADEKKEDE